MPLSLPNSHPPIPLARLFPRRVACALFIRHKTTDQSVRYHQSIVQGGKCATSRAYVELFFPSASILTTCMDCKVIDVNNVTVVRAPSLTQTLHGAYRMGEKKLSHNGHKVTVCHAPMPAHWRLDSPYLALLSGSRRDGTIM